MKASDLKPGLHVAYVSARHSYRYQKAKRGLIVSVERGNGHAAEHVVRPLEFDGTPTVGSTDVSCTSRQIIDRWENYAPLHAAQIAEQQAREQEAERKRSLEIIASEQADEVVSLLAMAGVDATHRVVSYWASYNKAPVVIETSDLLGLRNLLNRYFGRVA